MLSSPEEEQSNRNMKVLVTGAGSLLGQGIIRSLKWSSLDITVVAVDPSPLAAGLYWNVTPYCVPMAAHADYLAAISLILERERPHALLIGTDNELPILAANRGQLEREFGTKVIVSSPEVVGIADDKFATYLFLKEKGFSYPQSALSGDKNELISRVGFPIIVKPRHGSRSVGLSLARSAAELEEALAKLETPMIQELIGDDESEYTAGTLCFDGACKASIVMRRQLRDGNTYRAFVEPFGSLNEEVRAIAEALAPHGPANFQFRLDHGKLKVFEINCRFSGTTPLRALSGFPEVEMVLRREVLGERLSQPEIVPKILLRHWSETAISPGDLAPPWKPR